VETKYRDFIKEQHNERDAQLKTSHAVGGGDGGDDGGFGYDEVPSEPEDRDNNQGNFDGQHREHYYHRRLNQEAEDAAAAKTPTFVNPWAPQHHSSDEDNGEDEDWNQEPKLHKQRGRNRKQENRQANADGWKTKAEDMTNIYIVKPPVPPKAFISGRRVSAPALVPEAEDEVPLARGYGLDDAGSSVTSSCAKYAL
jgi:hypothetical protein